MDLTHIANIRLESQQLSSTKHTTAKGIVAFMGAMQAQDPVMAKWAVGVRLPDSTTEIIESAINKGEIIRTHLLRPTWHFVSADDIYWMLELTAPHIKSSLRSRHKELELSEAIFTRSHSLIEKVLSKEKHLTRAELMAELKKARIVVDENRSSHLMLRAELDGIVCSGATKGNKQTYTLLGNWVPKKKILTREEGLTELAHRYFSSHCPATLQDFVWWSGLPVRDARFALDRVKSTFISETIHSEVYWLTNSPTLKKTFKTSVHLLPAYDEFIISYKNRAASLASNHHGKAVSSNGIFRPVIVINGQVSGLWRRSIKTDHVIIETDFFHPPDKSIRQQLEKTAELYGQFLGKKLN